MKKPAKMEYAEFLELMEGIVSKFHESEKFCVNNHVKKVKGWLLPNTEAYNGEGWLISFSFINKKNPENIKFYAMSDEEIVGFIYLLMSALKEKDNKFSMEATLFTIAYARLSFDYNEEATDVKDWEMCATIKGNYESVEVQDNELPDLHLVEDFTYETFLNDMRNIQARGINLAQFVAEACLVFIRKEKRAA